LQSIVTKNELYINVINVLEILQVRLSSHALEQEFRYGKCNASVLAKRVWSDFYLWHHQCKRRTTLEPLQRVWR